MHVHISIISALCFFRRGKQFRAVSENEKKVFFSTLFFGCLNHEYPWSFYHHALNIGFAPDAYNYLTWALLFYFGQWKHAITDFPTLVAEPERMLWSGSAETDSIITELVSSSYTHISCDTSYMRGERQNRQKRNDWKLRFFFWWFLKFPCHSWSNSEKKK